MSNGQQGGSLEFADLDIVERDVQGNGTVFDEAIVTDDGDVLALGGCMVRVSG